MWRNGVCAEYYRLISHATTYLSTVTCSFYALHSSEVAAVLPRELSVKPVSRSLHYLRHATTRPTPPTSQLTIERAVSRLIGIRYARKVDPDQTRMLRLPCHCALSLCQSRRDHVAVASTSIGRLPDLSIIPVGADRRWCSR